MRSDRGARFNLRGGTQVDSEPWFADCDASSALLIATPRYPQRASRDITLDHQISTIHISVQIRFDYFIYKLQSEKVSHIASIYHVAGKTTNFTQRTGTDKPDQP